MHPLSAAAILVGIVLGVIAFCFMAWLEDYSTPLARARRRVIKEISTKGDV